MVTNNAANAQNAQYNLMVGTGSAYTNIAPSATSGVPLISQGNAANPAYGTAVVAGGGTGVTSNTAYAVLCGGTSSTNPIQSVASVGSAGQVLTSNGNSALPTFQGIAVLQQVRTSNATFTTITSGIPLDDTKPQNTEGTQILSVSITPKFSSSILKCEYIAAGTTNGSAVVISTLFRSDSNDAIQVTAQSASGAQWITSNFIHYETSGTTNSLTFSVRMGPNSTSGATIWLNGYDTSRNFGGSAKAELIITEYAS